MDEDWTTTVTRHIGARLQRALETDVLAITPLMADKLEQLRLAEIRLENARRSVPMAKAD